MNYQLENLGPERFQEICQALLIKAFPKLQCFPVSQPDGGRDALAYYIYQKTEEFIIFQVKFVRDPNNIEDKEKWAEEIISGEKDKVDKLITVGAKEYYLMTNVKGSAHFESGTIDKVQAILNEKISIPAQCWWRDDIMRRLDDSYDIKWAYPEVLSGTDVLRLIIHEGLSENNDRRTNAIRSFIKEQYEADKQVRFKQIDLQNNLLDLFVDLPIEVNTASKERQWYTRGLINDIYKRIVEIYPRYEEVFSDSYESYTQYASEIRIGAASFLLDHKIPDQLNRIVLEGAPGQGKSTVVQYVCQVHRSKMLNIVDDINKIPEIHKNLPVRLPIKLDLRDLSLWMAKRNPFEQNNKEIIEARPKTLEGFLSTLIYYQSGGHEFSVSDLIAVLKISSVLLVFDGLDEIADVTSRRNVIDEITKGIKRLEENCASLQVIITSRPAAFINSPGLPDNVFSYCELKSITKPIMDEYTTKWIKARALNIRDSKEVRRILESKIDQPHLKELSKNPMQLAILLSLIHTRGSSLPDKRTALYDSYIELFFNRESEKSDIVRAHRDLLIDIHRYLAWLLHSEVEVGTHRGSIEDWRLKQELKKYLNKEQHDESLADRLFAGVVERVVAIVSRVQGTYEFEVQPLREYFAARYLYDTANYSPPGNETTGTLPDRFDALARNAYWLNVTRFYSGCFSKGELPSLVDRIEELNKDEKYKYTCTPIILAATLLSDWVFTQHPRSMNKVISILFDRIGLYYIARSLRNKSAKDELFILPKQCGRDDLVKNSLDELKKGTNKDVGEVLIKIITKNTSQKENYDYWYNIISSVTKEERTRWFYYGLWGDNLQLLSNNDIHKLMSDAPEDIERLRSLLKSGHIDYYETDHQRFQLILNKILDGKLIFRSPFRGKSIIGDMICLLNPDSYYRASHQHKQPSSLSKVAARWLGYEMGEIKYENLCSEDAKKCVQFILSSRKEWDKPVKKWCTFLEPWNNVIEMGKELFGDKIIFMLYANISANIKSKTERCKEYNDLLDINMPLCKRFRYARLQTLNIKWWTGQLDKISSDYEVINVLLPLLTWAGKKVIDKLITRLDDLIIKLSDETWQSFINILRESQLFIDNKNIMCEPKKLSHRTVNSIILRMHPQKYKELFGKYLDQIDFFNNVIYRMYLISIGWNKECSDIKIWRQLLLTTSKIYRDYKHKLNSRYFYYSFKSVKYEEMPIEIAQDILKTPQIYPIDLMAIAEQRWQLEIKSQTKPVFEIAKANKWWPEQ